MENERQNMKIGRVKPLFNLLRVHQYVKNSFVWVGAIFAQRFDAPTLVAVGLAFVAFCAAASAVYVLNDIWDAEADRQHPSKRSRPIASGAVPLSAAWTLCAALSVLAMGAALGVGWLVAAFTLAYMLLNVAYSWRLKHVVILDVFIIAAGFMLRILAGTVGVAIPPSQWLLLTGLMLTLFLGFAKRRAELLMLENAGKADRASVRRVLDDYSPVVLDQLTGITAACTILSYGVYTVSAESVKAHGTYALFYTLPFVIYGMFRYLFLLHHRARGGDTAKDLMTDPHLITVGLGWLAVTLAVLA